MTRIVARPCIALALAWLWSAGVAAGSAHPDGARREAVTANTAKAAEPLPAARLKRSAHAAHASRLCERESCGRIALPAWHAAQLHYSTSGTPLVDVLHDLSQQTQVPVACGAQLTGRVEGRFDMPPQRFLEVLARSFDLAWFYDGTVLHVDSARAQPTRVFRLNYASSADLRALLARTGNDDPRFPLRVDAPAHGLVTLRAPAAYLSLVERAAQQLETAARRRVKTSVRIVPLRYGTATDRTALTNDRSNVVLGIASRAASVLDPHGDIRADVIDYEAPLPVITADPRTNAVLIRDRPPRLDDDAHAVAALDRPEQLVGIRLLIAAVRPETLSALGMSDASHVLLEGASVKTAADAIRHASGARVLADSELLSVDGVAVGYESKAQRPVASTGAVAVDAGASELPEASPSGPEAPGGRYKLAGNARHDADVAVRILPSLASMSGHGPVVLAVEWHGADIDVVRMALDPGDGLLMIERPPIAQAGVAQQAVKAPLAWVAVLVPRLLPD
ncbi:secretin N-terminal domain-containing protein [Paraburkholderia strydomiana]|uniref:Secretin N-terminal domain-containing protein n=1 Tax=Paraburkholderia strydomiana TaxID=1245417 RepID=A0ABW9EQP3_9BURK